MHNTILYQYYVCVLLLWEGPHCRFQALSMNGPHFPTKLTQSPWRRSQYNVGESETNLMPHCSYLYTWTINLITVSLHRRIISDKYFTTVHCPRVRYLQLNLSNHSIGIHFIFVVGPAHVLIVIRTAPDIFSFCTDTPSARFLTTSS